MHVLVRRRWGRHGGGEGGGGGGKLGDASPILQRELLKIRSSGHGQKSLCD